MHLFSPVRWLRSVGRYLLGYDAVELGNRRSRPIELGSEDDVLRPRDSRQLHSDVRQLYRNTAILPWMIRRHLDFVSGFEFSCSHENKEFRDTIEKWVARRGKAENCDVTRRFTRSQLMRFSEALRLIEGEVLHVHRADQRWQLVRKDRLKDPEEAGSLKWIDGIGVDSDGAPQGYAVYKRLKGGGHEFEAIVSAEVARLHGYFELGTDQYHGVSPLACGVNDLKDLYSGKTLALAKMKLGQLLALVLTENQNPIPGRVDAPGVAKVSDNGAGQPKSVKVDLGGEPQTLRLKPGEKAEFLNPQVAGSDFINFNEAVLMLCLKCLDLPYSFAREDFTNWVGQQSAMQIYKASCRHRREANQELLMWHTRIELQAAVLSGEIVLPAGETVDSVLEQCTWVPIGLPWWNPSKQIEGDAAAVRHGFTDPFKVCAENGTDYEENLKARKRAEDLAREYGVEVEWAKKSKLKAKKPKKAKQGVVA